MDRITCSLVMGKTNIKHNYNDRIRKFQGHIDYSKTSENIFLKIPNVPDNEVYLYNKNTGTTGDGDTDKVREPKKINLTDEDIEKAFNKIFEDDVIEYNKGKKPCRQIKNYYQKCLANQKMKNPVRELVVQIGDKDNMKDFANRQRAVKVLEDFYKDFEKNYPNLKPIGAVIHLDESTPHLHLSVVPYAEKEKSEKARGLNHKVSFQKALEQMGFKPEKAKINKTDKPAYVFNGFRNDCQERLDKAMNNEGFEREDKHVTYKHLEPEQYRQMMREKTAIKELKEDPKIKEQAKEELKQYLKKEEYQQKIQNFDKIQQENTELKKKNEKLQDIIVKEKSDKEDILISNIYKDEKLNFVMQQVPEMEKIFNDMDNFYYENNSMIRNAEKKTNDLITEKFKTENHFKEIVLNITNSIKGFFEKVIERFTGIEE